MDGHYHADVDQNIGDHVAEAIKAQDPDGAHEHDPIHHVIGHDHSYEL